MLGPDRFLLYFFLPPLSLRARWMTAPLAML